MSNMPLIYATDSLKLCLCRPGALSAQRLSPHGRYCPIISLTYCPMMFRRRLPLVPRLGGSHPCVPVSAAPRCALLLCSPMLSCALLLSYSPLIFLAALLPSLSRPPAPRTWTPWGQPSSPPPCCRASKTPPTSTTPSGDRGRATSTSTYEVRR